MAPDPILELGLPGSRVLLVGTGSHVTGSALPDVPAVEETVKDLKQALIERCGVAPDHVRELIDPKNLVEFAGVLTETARQATDTLLVYFVGHGLISPDGEFYLATHATDHLSEDLSFKALSFSTVRKVLTTCTARSQIVLLDCCFSGQARGALGTPVAEAFQPAYVHGSFLLTAASGDEVALAPPGERHTAFTGALLNLLEKGDPAAPPTLTWEQIYRHLDRTLPERGRTRPQRQAEGNAGDLVLALNPAYQPPPGPTPQPPIDLPCPYRGLRPFDERDVQYFFGRERLVAESVRRLAERRQGPDAGPLLVVGPSGSGKSSLLHAGLLPALNRGAMDVPGSSTWPQRIMTPGDRPAATLAALLMEFSRPNPGTGGAQPSHESLYKEILADPQRTRTALRQALAHSTDRRDIVDGRLVLVVDQFEEVFTDCQDEHERGRFIQALCAASGQGSDGPAPLLVVLGIRADFYAECLAYPELKAAIEHGQFVVGPVSAVEAREMIERPAEAVGLLVEPGFIDLVLHDLRADHPDERGSGGALPLLSYALQATWHKREGATLTLAGYRATGGIWGAVSQSADAIYENLGPAQQKAARLLLLRMVRISDRAEDTRRRLDLNELLAGRPADEAAAIIHARDAFADPDARLITLTRDGVEITHEALLRAWERLRQWISEDREWLVRRQSLDEAARSWVDEGRHPTGLYQGPRLKEARTQTVDRREELSAVTAEFLSASRRRSRLRQALSASIALLLVVAAGVGFYAVQASRNDAQQRRDTVSTQLATLSTNALNGFGSLPYDTDVRALAAWQTTDTPQARGALMSAAMTSYAGLLPNSGTADAESLAATGNGHYVAVGDGCASANPTACGELRAWNMSTRQEVVDQAYPGPVTSVAFSPDGRMLAVTAIDPKFRVQVWDTKTMRPSFTLGTGGGGAVAFSPDDTTIAVGTGNGSVALWNTTTRTEIRPALQTGSITYSLAFSPNGRLVAAGEKNGGIDVWNTVTGARVVDLTPDPESVQAVAFSPNGKTLATAGWDSSVRLWSVPGYTQTAEFHPVDADFNDFSSVAFSPDGSTLFAGGTDRNIASWDLTTDTNVGDVPYNGLNQVTSLAVTDNSMIFSGYGNGDVLVQNTSGLVAAASQPVYGAAVAANASHLVATGAADGYIRLWDSGTTSQVRALNAQSSVGQVAFSPNATSLAAGGHGQVTVWNPTTGALEHSLALPNGELQAYQVGYSADGRFLVASVIPVLQPTLATSLPADSIEVWDTSTWREVLTITSSKTSENITFALPTAGSTLAVNRNNAIELWDLATGHMAATWSTGSSIPVALAFAPNSTTLLVGNEDGTINEWDTVNHTVMRTLLGAPSSVQALAVSADGTKVAVAGQDPLIEIYDLSTGDLYATLQGHTQTVNELAFSPDGNNLLSAASDGTALWWDLDPKQDVHTLCQAVSGPSLAGAWNQLSQAMSIDIGKPGC